jgi:nucleotidyltransferase/DNA polymerase involved in DNA repair
MPYACMVLLTQLLGGLDVSDLPGVGWSLKSKLADMGITQVRQVRT